MKDKYPFPALSVTAKVPLQLQCRDTGKGLVETGALAQEGTGNISPPGLQLPISLLCKLPSWGSRWWDLSDWTLPSSPTPGSRAAGGGAGTPPCRGSLCPKHSETQLPLSQSEPQDPTPSCLETGFFMTSWPFFIAFSRIATVGSMHTSKADR